MSPKKEDLFSKFPIVIWRSPRDRKTSDMFFVDIRPFKYFLEMKYYSHVSYSLNIPNIKDFLSVIFSNNIIFGGLLETKIF